MLSYSLWSMHLDVLAGPGWQLVSHLKISQLIHLRTRTSVVAYVCELCIDAYQGMRWIPCARTCTRVAVVPWHWHCCITRI
jgi:hypothetical protein